MLVSQGDPAAQTAAGSPACLPIPCPACRELAGHGRGWPGLVSPWQRVASPEPWCRGGQGAGRELAGSCWHLSPALPSLLPRQRRRAWLPRLRPSQAGRPVPLVPGGLSRLARPPPGWGRCPRAGPMPGAESGPAPGRCLAGSGPTLAQAVASKGLRGAWAPGARCHPWAWAACGGSRAPLGHRTGCRVGFGWAAGPCRGLCVCPEGAQVCARRGAALWGGCVAACTAGHVPHVPTYTRAGLRAGGVCPGACAAGSPGACGVRAVPRVPAGVRGGLRRG